MNRIVVLPDVHCPNNNAPAMKSILKFIKVYKPNCFVQLGDFCDWDALSTYEAQRESDLTNLQTEIEQSNFLLDDIEKALPKGCAKYMIGGNHEARYAKFSVSNRHDTRIRQLWNFRTWQQEYNLGKRGFKSCEYGEYFEIGKIIFTHGWYTGQGCAKKHLGLFHKNMIFGHTHMFDIATGLGLDGHPTMAASIGTLSNFDLAYLRGKPPINWINMFMYIDMREDGTFSPHFVPIIDGKFVELGREFSPT